MKTNWPTKKLGEAVKLQGGFAFKSSDYKIEGIPLIRIQNLQDELIDLSKVTYISKTEQKKFNQFFLNEGDILIAMSGATTGKLAIISKKELPAVLNQRVGRFIIDEKKLDKTFLWFF